MSDTDYMPSHVDSISETQSGNESPVIVGTPTTQEQRKSRAKKRQNQHHEQESALASAQQEHERKNVKDMFPVIVLGLPLLPQRKKAVQKLVLYGTIVTKRAK